ncbi:hypothetical protein ACSL103130_06970 [Actinomyces slackii]
MDDTGVMDRSQGGDQAVSQIGQVAGVSAQVVDALVVDLVLEGGAVDQLGDDEGDPRAALLVVAGLDVEDAGHPRVAHAGQHAGLAIQAAPRGGVGGDLRM